MGKPEEALEKLKGIFENQSKYETEVFVKIVHALTVEAGEPAQEYLGQIIMTSGNTMLIPKIIKIMGVTGGDKAIPYIVDTMKSKSTPGIATETAATLRKIGSLKAKEALELLYEVKLDPVMKDLFKRSLDDLIRDNPIEYVWMPRLLLGKTMTSACTSAANSLARVAKEKAVPYILKEILNPDLLIRTVIITALGDIGSDIVVEKLFEVFHISLDESGKKGEYAKAVTDFSAKVTPESIEEELFTYIDKSILEEFKPKTKDLLVVYNEKDPDKISDEIDKLKREGLTGSVSHIISFLKYQPYKGAEYFKKAEEYVIKEISMESAEHGAIMAEVIMTLGKILEKTRSKEDVIKEFLLQVAEKLENDELKARSIEILGEIKGDDIVSKLTEFTKDKSWKIREKAVFSLGENGAKTAIDILKTCCEDMHQDVSASAMTALGKIDKNAVIALFDSTNWRIRRLSLEVARTFDDPTIIEPAKKLLADDKYDVAFEAINTIGSIESEKSIDILSELVKKDGPARIQEKIIEKLESISTYPVLRNLVEALESEVPLPLYANLQRSLVNVITSADYEIEHEIIVKIKNISIAGMDKRDLKVRLNAITLASEVRGLNREEYEEVIEKLKDYEKLKTSRNPQEKAIVLAAENAKSIMLKKISEIEKLAGDKQKIESLYGEIFDKNEMRSQNAISEVWSLFSKTDLSEDRPLRKVIWQKFSERFLSPEASPRIRESLAKIFGDFLEPMAVPMLLKFKDSKMHGERMAIEGALKKLTEAFSREEIVAAAKANGAAAPPASGGQPPQQPEPAAEAEPATSAEPESVESNVDHQGAAIDDPNVDHKVLIVDDALVMRNLYSKMLKEKGYITDVAKDAVETFEKVKANEYHIILLDLKLPDVDGLEVLKKVPEISKNKDVKVIIVSSYLDSENTKQAVDLGASAVMAKPLDIDMLSTKIKVVLR